MINESISILDCNAPDVPNLIKFNDFLFFRCVLVSKSIFTNASNSFTTISILSVPIPVDIALILVLFKTPVCVINSLF